MQQFVILNNSRHQPVSIEEARQLLLSGEPTYVELVIPGYFDTGVDSFQLPGVPDASKPIEVFYAGSRSVPGWQHEWTPDWRLRWLSPPDGNKLATYPQLLLITYYIKGN